MRWESQGRAFYYTAVSDRETFMGRVADRVLEGLLRDFGRPTLAHLIDAADPAQLAEFEALLRSRRRD